MGVSEREVDLKAAALMFNWVEYCVFCSMLLLSILIGVYYGWFKKQDTVAEYMLGGKKMSIVPVFLSLTFSHVSGITLLGIPAEVYSYGTQYAAVVLFSNFALYFLVNYLYMPVFYNLQLRSLYEYLELRFDKTTRTLASLIFALSLVLFIPVVVYVPALAFNEVTGVSVHLIASIVSIVCIFYTSFGGLKAVLWTDALQSLFTLTAISFIIFIGFWEIGSVSEILRINEEGGRLELFNMDPNPFARNTFWTMFIGSTFFWVSQLGAHPGAVQRFMAVSTIQEAKMVTLCSCLSLFLIKGLALAAGVLLYAVYHDCDPLAIKLVQKPGQMMPLYVMRVAKDFPGITGLFISGVVSAALSTMSAGLNTVAGTLYEDFVQFILKGKKQTEVKQNLSLKVICVVLGIVFTGLVWVVEKLGSIYQVAQSLIGVTNGALVGVFTLGLLFPRANAKGALAGTVASLVCMTIIVVGAQLYIAEGLLRFPRKVTSISGCPTNLTASLSFNASARLDTYTGIGSPVVADPSVALIFQLSYQYYVFIGTLIVLLVGLPVSYLTEASPPECLDKRLFASCVRRFLPDEEVKKPPPEEYRLVDGPVTDNTEKPCDDAISLQESKKAIKGDVTGTNKSNKEQSNNVTEDQEDNKNHNEGPIGT